MLKAKELRDQSIEELEAELSENKKVLFELRNELRRSKKLEKPHKIKEAKRDIARLHTVINQKRAPVA